MRGSASGGGVGQTQHRILRDTVNEWAVRIQLECFFVWLTFLTENCMEMNEIGPGAFPVPPLDPLMEALQYLSRWFRVFPSQPSRDSSVGRASA